MDIYALDYLLRISLQVANDIIPFEAHCAYLKEDDVPMLWQFPEGARGAIPGRGELEQCRELHRASSPKGLLQVELPNTSHPLCCAQLTGQTSRTCHVLVAPLLSGSEIDGFVAVARDTEYGPFTVVEEEQLRCVIQLLESALQSQGSKELLERLAHALFDKRSILQDAPSQFILEQYVGKVASVCHPDRFQGEGDASQGGEPETVRLTAKLVTPNDTMLRVAAFSSSDREERDRDLSKLRYVISEDKSIATKVFTNCHSHFSKDYQQEVDSDFRVFGDTRRHISVPIVAGRLRCLGVLSIETTSAAAYDENTVAALSLIGANACSPLERALNREESIRKSREIRTVGGTKQRLKSQADDIGILEHCLAAGLSELEYKRGMFCRVESTGEIVGVIAWGGCEMEELCAKTRRNPVDHPLDCQVLTVKHGIPQVILNPETDQRAHPEAREVANIKPFAVFPLFDHHRRVVWTLHVERLDTSPIGEQDQRLVEELCNAAMAAREENVRAHWEALWLLRVFEVGFHSRDRLIEAFCEFVAGHEIAERCRAFLVDLKNEKQIGFYQAGKRQIAGFTDLVLDSRVMPAFAPLAEKLQPTLVVVKSRGRRRLAVSDDNEYSVVQVDADPHGEVFGDRSQWLEIPLVVDGKIVAKVVLDYIGVPDDSLKLGEVRHFTRLSRLLTLAAETVEMASHTVRLSQFGLQYRFLTHHLFRIFDPLYLSHETKASEGQILAQLGDITRILARLEGNFRRRPLRETHDSLDFGQDIELAKDIVRPFARSVELDILPDQELGTYNAPHRPLFQILLMLLTNAIDAFTDAGRVHGKIRVWTKKGQDELRVFVEDTGPGFSEASAADIKTILSNPSKALRKRLDQSTGLVYSAYLAETLGWSILLESLSEPTRFVIQIRRPEGARG